MTFLETILTLTLLIVVPWAVWSAIDLIALRRDVRALGADADRLDSRVGEHRQAWGRRLWDHHLRLAALEDAHDTIAPLDVPDVAEPDQPTTPTYRPVPEHFNEWR